MHAPATPQTARRASLIACPVCKRPLLEDAHGADCAGGHHFNRAREGYLNLLRSSKAGDATGDPKAAARSRRDFLDRGYYQPLRDKLVELVGERVRTQPAEGRRAGGRVPVLDICCGEGYYTDALARIAGADVYGFDLAKEMVRLAARRNRSRVQAGIEAPAPSCTSVAVPDFGAAYFVANLKAIPVADGAFSVATHLFAPFNGREFARVLRPGGSLFTVVPGARHLLGLKEVLYDTPYLNDERLPEAQAAESGLKLVGRAKVTADVVLATPADIESVFQMTPYYYRTRSEDRARLAGLATLATPVEFVIGEFRRA